MSEKGQNSNKSKILVSNFSLLKALIHKAESVFHYFINAFISPR